MTKRSVLWSLLFLLLLALTSCVSTTSQTRKAGEGMEAETPRSIVAGLEAAENGDYSEAVKRFNSAIEKKGMSAGMRARAYAGRGDVLLDTGEYFKAIDDYTAAVKLDPDNADAYNSRGFAWSDLEEYDKAIDDFSHAVGIDPGFADAYTNRGNASARKGGFEIAIEDYGKAIAVDPEYADAYTARGRAYFYKGEFESAEADFKKSGEIEPDIYTAIALYVARIRRGRGAGGRKALARQTEDMDLITWPGPVVALFLGKITPTELVNRSKDVDAEREKQKRCEAFYYLGQYSLAKGNRKTAARMFQESVVTDVTNFVEFHGSMVELKKMGK